MHDKNIIHHDIKPANIMINININNAFDLKNVHLILIDFGGAEINENLHRYIGTISY